MELFSKNDKNAKDYYDFKEAREKFTERNNEMTETIKDKTIDSGNVDFAQAHINIYEGVGLGTDWRVDKSDSANDINQASQGFKKVSLNLQPKRDKSMRASSLLGWIKGLFSEE